MPIKNDNTVAHIDWYILLSVSGLLLFSIAFVYSASAGFAEARFGEADKFFWLHSVRVLIAMLALIIFAKIDYHIWKKFSKALMILSIIALMLVFVIGSPINNVYRWLSLGFMSFQPSELAKFALVFHFATILTEREDCIKSFKYGMLPLLLWTFLVCGLIALQPNFSTAFVIFLISVIMMFVGNTNLLHLFSLGGIMTIIAGLYAISAPYRLQRFLTFFGGSQASETADRFRFQGEQAILAFGNGGLFGVGPGQSRQSHLFLPESYGDFIFSIIGEEYGFIGTVLVILVFLIIFWRGMLVIKYAPDKYGYFLAIGILVTFILYAAVSAGVNTGLLPTTGLPMPFVSYGGTAVIIYGAAMGVLLNISAQSGVFPGRFLRKGFKKKS